MRQPVFLLMQTFISSLISMYEENMRQRWSCREEPGGLMWRGDAQMQSVPSVISFRDSCWFQAKRSSVGVLLLRLLSKQCSITKRFSAKSRWFVAKWKKNLILVWLKISLCDLILFLKWLFQFQICIFPTINLKLLKLFLTVDLFSPFFILFINL